MILHENFFLVPFDFQKAIFKELYVASWIEFLIYKLDLLKPIPSYDTEYHNLVATIEFLNLLDIALRQFLPPPFF